MENKAPNTCILAFYNMRAEILFQGTILEETLAVKNVWEKDTGTILDVYFYRSKTSRIIDAAYIKSLKDLNTDKHYANVEEFIEDFKREHLKRLIEAEELDKTEKKPKPDFKYLKDFEDDLILLGFLSRLNEGFGNIKVKVIADYIRRYKPQAYSLSEQYMSAYLNTLDLSEDSFFEALDNMSKHPTSNAVDILKDGIKLCASDGTISYLEKMYLAEILQNLKDHGIEPNVEF